MCAFDNKFIFQNLIFFILDASFHLLNLSCSQWFNPKTLVAIDTTERLHLVDVRTEEELEVVDLVDIELVYGSSFFKSLATGGNVSQAMVSAGQRSK